jgi:hypothetical protein
VHSPSVIRLCVNAVDVNLSQTSERTYGRPGLDLCTPYSRRRRSLRPRSTCRCLLRRLAALPRSRIVGEAATLRCALVVGRASAPRVRTVWWAYGVRSGTAYGVPRVSMAAAAVVVVCAGRGAIAAVEHGSQRLHFTVEGSRRMWAQKERLASSGLSKTVGAR